MPQIIPTDYFCSILAIHLQLIQKSLKLSRNDRIAAYICNRALRQAKDLQALVFFIPHVTFCVDWDSLMAKNKPDFNLIDYRLSDQELEQFESWVASQKPTPIACLSDFAEKEYKISLSFVENSEAWCISITGKPDAKFNSASTLTTWSDDPFEGIVMAHFKVFTVFSGGVWKTKTQNRRG